MAAPAAIGGGDVACGGAGLGGGEPLRLAGDDHRPAEQGEAERLDCLAFDFDRFGGVRQQAAHLARFGFEGRGQVLDRQHGGDDPGRDDQEAQPDDHPPGVPPAEISPREGREFLSATALRYPGRR